MEKRVYISIDLKSFYASVECIIRNLDPLKTNLVVADISRTEKTICLAVTPPLKKYGIPGRARLFEVIEKVNEINKDRKSRIKGEFKGKSVNEDELAKDPYLKLDFIAATPKMAYYMKYSLEIYKIYLKYFSKDDIFVYSIDEIFCDITDYLKMYNLTPTELVTKVLKEVYEKTKITATAGIGTNLYLCKVAMDILAKHVKPNSDGVRIASLDEIKYRKLLWTHRPITDFWRVGSGYAKRLEKANIYTMGDIARMSITNEEVLYKMFGVNAELLIDHSWGYETCSVGSVKSYVPTTNSISLGQVLSCGYEFSKALIIVKEMAEKISLDLTRKKFLTKQLTVMVNYDVVHGDYDGEVDIDRYGRTVPKHTRMTINLDSFTSSSSIIIQKVEEAFSGKVNRNLKVKRLNISANNVKEVRNEEENENIQLDLFNNYEERIKKREKELKERKLQEIINEIKERYGKNSVLKGMNYIDGATMIERNGQIGGHRS